MPGSEELENTSAEELAEQARAALGALARRTDLTAFQELLGLSEYVGECVGESARNLAENGSWSQVAEATGTTKQAVWSRWRG
jgi:hypothetical protein